MTRKLAFALLGTSAVLSLSAPASAAGNQQCGSRDHVVNRLTGYYGETRQSIGLGTNNQVVEVYASSDTGTWTITVTSPNGTTCLVASGRSYEEMSGQGDEKAQEAL